MTPQLSAFVAAGRTAELADAAQRTRRGVDEPADKPVIRRHGWLARLRAARQWQQECPEHLV